MLKDYRRHSGARVALKSIGYIFLTLFLSMLCASFNTANAQLIGTPSPTSPANGSTNQTIPVTLTWSGVTLATSYEVQVSTDNTFGSVQIDQTTSGTSYSAGGLAQGATYYWRVRAESLVIAGAWSAVWSFTTAAGSTPPPTPSLVSPSNGASGESSSVTFTWNASASATSYDLEVATDGGFTSIVSHSSGIAGTSQQVSGLAAGTTYYWRVDAVNSAGSSAWSSPWSFSLASNVTAPSAPALASPSNGATGQPTTVTFNWNASSGATSYNLQVATDNGFGSIVSNKSGIGATSVQVSGLTAGTTYYWRVDGVNSAGPSAWSDVWSLSTAPSVAPPSAPSLASPANGSTNQPTSLLLSWNSAAGATHYWLQVATDQAFTSIVIGDSTVTSTSYQANYLSASTTYYWRIKAINSAGQSSWSSVWSFSTSSSTVNPPSTPTLVSPADGAAGLSATLTCTWNAAANADHYFLQVATDRTFSNIVYSNYTIIGTSQQVSGLSQNTTYYWQVRAVNAGGQSNWSTIWSFTTNGAPASAPSLLSPANGATGLPGTIAFIWTGTSGASAYRLEIAAGSNFTNIFYDDSSLTDTTRTVTGFAGSATYYWRVEPYNSSGGGPWSSVWSFTTKSVQNVPAVPTLVSPANGSTNLPLSDTLEWGASANASSYRIQLAAAPDFSKLVSNDSLITGTSFIEGSLAGGSTYYWRVEAVNAAGVSGWSTSWSFSTAQTAQPPSAPSPLYPLNQAVDMPLSDTLSWTPVQNASYYQLAFSTYPSLDSTVVQDSTVETSRKLVAGLQPATVYWWEVRAVSQAGASAWSAKRDFETAPASSFPSTPVLISPANGATSEPLADTLSWKPVSNAGLYMVEVAASSAFDSLVFVDSSVTTTGVVTGILSPGTSYWWRVRAENNLGPGDWSAIWVFTTSATPALGPVLSSPANGIAGLPTTVVFSWNANASDTSYDLQLAANPSFLPVIVDDSSIDVPSFTIRSLTDGTTYYWRVKARSSLTGTWTPFSAAWHFTTSAQQGSPGTVTVAVDIYYPTLSNGETLKSTDYRLVGLPGASNLPMTTFLKGGPGKSWIAYWDNGAPTNYLTKYNPSSTDSLFKFALGRAFWLIKDGPFIVDTTVTAAPIDSLGATGIPLHAGWNLITDPFADSVAWGAVQVANSIDAPLYTFRGAFQTASALQPGYGYYYFNSSNLQNLVVPSPGTSAGTNPQSMAQKAEGSTGWSVNVVLKSEGVTDNAAWFGVSSSVSRDFNDLDARKPDGMDFAPSMYFSHPEWDRNYSAFASEIHPTFSDMSEWTLQVISAPGRSATLEFDGIENVPSSFDVYALNPVTGSWIDLRESPAMTLNPVSRTTSVDVLVGRPDAVKQRITKNVASSIRVGANYPDPFNPSTTIPVYTPAASHVDITIYNIIGQKVDRVFDGELQDGNHSFVWNGTDRAGRLVPSGVYFVRVASDKGRTVIRKMVLLK